MPRTLSVHRALELHEVRDRLQKNLVSFIDVVHQNLKLGLCDLAILSRVIE